MLYKVISKETGEEAYSYESDLPIEFDDFKFNFFDHIGVPINQPVVELPVNVYDNLTFLRRFTAEERKAVWASQPLNADLDDAIRLLMSTDKVHSNDPDVIRILTLLESSGLIAQGRMQEILYG